MFDRIAARKLIEQQREDLLFGILNATVANYSFCAPEKPRRPIDFMINPPKVEKRELTREEAAERVRAKLMRLFGSPEQTTILGH